MITSQASSECLMKMVKNEGLGFKILSFFALFFFIVSLLLLFLREEERERKEKKQKHPSAASSEPLTGVEPVTEVRALTGSRIRNLVGAQDAPSSFIYQLLLFINHLLSA